MALLIWKGPSEFDGKPVVLALTLGSQNSKTGDCDTLWVLDEFEFPHAIGTEATCGTCSIKTTCYVCPHTKANVFKALRGKDIEPMPVPSKPRMLRVTGAGDLGAIPPLVVRDLLKRPYRFVGYTHAWRARPDLRSYCMASVETEADMFEAHMLGWRTFRVVPEFADDKVLADNETWCRSHKGLQCNRCLQCTGTSGSGPSFAIRAHGYRRRNLERGEKA